MSRFELWRVGLRIALAARDRRQRRAVERTMKRLRMQAAAEVLA